MLNCCIDRKKARQANVQQSSSEPQTESLSDGSSTDEDEFFDCEEEVQIKRKEKHSLWNQPVGRLGKFENLKLIKNGDPLYIPVTQEPVPKTEDQLEEDTDVLLKLGSDAQGSELRAKMMSASLLSDMESFKAANPGSILDDFIRWYSPRDWIEEDGLDEWGQKKGRLSSRMLITGNTWVEMWESAKPVPANRQKRLFDDTREAEKVLHFFDSRTLSQISDMLMSVLTQAAIYRIVEELQQVSALQKRTEAIQTVIKSLERLSRDSKVNSRRFENLIQEVAPLELEISQENSLLYKFNPMGTVDESLRGLATDLILGREVEIDERANSDLGKRISSMFSDAQNAANLMPTEQGYETTRNGVCGAFNSASEREFVMRVTTNRPCVYSAKSPQFLRAILNKNEFRLTGAFTEDIVFF